MQKLTGFCGGVKQARVGLGNKLFSSFMRRYLENGTRYDLIKLICC